jgi:tRNA A-37 threonylcarbamoyl transferase component Bud32
MFILDLHLSFVQDLCVCNIYLTFLFMWLSDPPDLSKENLQIMGLKQTLQATHSTGEWYLDHARQCMEHVQLMTSGKNVSTKVKIHYNQCQYLADTLKMVVEISSRVLGPMYAQTQTRTHTKLAINSPSERKTKSMYRLGILMLLWQSATELEHFIKDCCSINWLKISVTSGSVAQSPLVSVSSWGYQLNLCKFVLLHNDTSGATSLTTNDLESMKEGELLVVKEKASVDDATLLNTLSLILSSNSSKTDEFQLATILYKRLEVKQTMLTTGGRLEASHEHFKIDSRALERGRALGQGRSGYVNECTWYGAKVATKTIISRTDDGLDRVLKEVSISSGLNHPNIVHMLGYSYNESECIIVMELMDMDLSSLIQKKLQNLGNDSESTPFNIQEVVDLMLQVADGMNYLHQLKVVHRDLKPSNILVGRMKATNLSDNVPDLLYVKVADFGLSVTKLESMTYSHQTMNTGTPSYMAPELMRKEGDEWDPPKSAKYPFKSDIYSFGICCYEILTGNMPLLTLDHRAMKNAILNVDRPSLPKQCPQELKTLIEACWHPNPTSRPSSTQICQTLRYLKYTLLLWTGMSLIIPHFMTIASYFLFIVQLTIYYPSSFKRHYKDLVESETTLRLDQID